MHAHTFLSRAYIRCTRLNFTFFIADIFNTYQVVWICFPIRFWDAPDKKCKANMFIKSCSRKKFETFQPTVTKFNARFIRRYCFQFSGNSLKKTMSISESSYGHFRCLISYYLAKITILGLKSPFFVTKITYFGHVWYLYNSVRYLLIHLCTFYWNKFVFESDSSSIDH